ncbi:TadE/TadG family type IV pilus assembly protein [Beijerinckia sp. L45]|uniref:TadE/TadG family type IV pilus assembly protein n=1 Tax=Beijerinckia sp. L45 TaxID=1641855 RepID=UPI00131ABAD7|nr:TadE/TadG family type IV pilus assembly protein [Beijerinckia sp. L45]
MAKLPIQTLRSKLGKFASETSAIAAVEFAIVMPMLIILIVGGAETARFITTSRKITNLSSSMAALLAERTTAVALNDLMFTFNSTLVTFPQILKDAAANGVPWQYDIGVTLSSIRFTPTVAGCASGCTYKASVIWSAGSTGQRSCIVPPSSTPDATSPSLSTLPQDVFTSGTIVVADVSFTYRPVFGSRFVPTAVLKRSVYLQPRYIGEIDFDASGGGLGSLGKVC